MSLLLDTNIIIPILRQATAALPPAVQRMLETERNFRCSVASLWEIAIKARLGKLPLPMGLELLPAMLTAGGVEMIAIRPEHVLAELSVLPTTKDPFDRLLLAVCAVEGLRLVTRDAKLVSHPLAWRPASA